MKQHLKLCPWCRNDIDARIHQFMPPHTDYRYTKIRPLEAGELWSVKDSLSGWGEKGRYYNAPVVLVIDVPDKQLVSVLQVHDDIHLSGPGDLSLFPDIEGFAEKWNRYSLSIDDLAFPLGRISPEKLHDLQSEFPENSFEIEQGSLLWFFRNMEVESGYFFARQSIEKLLLRLESTQDETPQTSTSPLLRYANATELTSDLRRLSLQFPSQLPESMPLFDTLAFAAIPDILLPLAAADTLPTVNALVFTCSGGKIQECITHRIEITLQETQGEKLLLAGKSLDPLFKYEEFLCWWKTDTEMQPPLPGTSGFKDGTFWATFLFADDRHNVKEGRLIIRILRKR